MRFSADRAVGLVQLGPNVQNYFSPLSYVTNPLFNQALWNWAIYGEIKPPEGGLICEHFSFDLPSRD